MNEKIEKIETIDYGEIRIVKNDMYLKDECLDMIDGLHGEQYEIRTTIHNEIVALLLDTENNYFPKDFKDGFDEQFNYYDNQF